jgi:AbiV family abortive infection protein
MHFSAISLVAADFSHFLIERSKLRFRFFDLARRRDRAVRVTGCLEDPGCAGGGKPDRLWQTSGMNKQLKPYSGRLSAAEVTAGIVAAQANAERLISDAKVLIQAERFPSATALAILAMEERGKVTILRRLALLSDDKDVRDAWRDYRSHRAKNTGWILPTLVAGGARTMEGLRPATEKNAEHTFVLDALKQVAVYTDCLGDRHWSLPEEVIDADLARSMIASAELMWGSRAVSEREIELWMDVVAPHYAKPGMAGAVVAFQAALHAEGLSDTAPESLQAFMEGRPVDLQP